MKKGQRVLIVGFNQSSGWNLGSGNGIIIEILPNKRAMVLRDDGKEINYSFSQLREKKNQNEK